MLNVQRYTSKTLSKIQRSQQRAIETLDIEPHEDSPGPEEEDAAENDPFAGYHGHSDPTIAESDSWLSQGTIDYKKGDVKAF